jgi:hypothetical protein
MGYTSILNLLTGLLRSCLNVSLASRREADGTDDLLMRLGLIIGSSESDPDLSYPLQYLISHIVMICVPRKARALGLAMESTIPRMERLTLGIQWKRITTRYSRISIEAFHSRLLQRVRSEYFFYLSVYHTENHTRDDRLIMTMCF